MNDAGPNVNGHPGKLRRQLEAGVGVAASLAGLGVYVYLLGGVVMWLRFTAARLPADEALSAVDAKQLLAMGFKALLVGLVLLALIAGVAWTARCVVRLRLPSRPEQAEPEGSKQSPIKEQPPGAWAVVLLGIALGIAVAPLAAKHGYALLASTSPLITSVIGGSIGAFVSALIDERTDKGWMDSPFLKWLITVITVAIALVFLSAPTGVAVIVLVVLAHFGGRLKKLPWVDNLRNLIPAVLILGACLGLVVAVYLATPPVSLDRIMVETSSGATISGGYLGRTGDGIALTRCSPKEASAVVSRGAHVVVIPTSEVKAFTIGGSSYSFDYGKNPSLIDLGRYYLEGGKVDEITPTSSVDIRADRFVCGLTGYLNVLGAKDEPRRGEAIESVNLFGKSGTIEVDGPEVRWASTESHGDLAVGMPIAPEGRALARLRRSGHATVLVRTRFAVKGEEIASQKRELTLRLARGPLRANAR